MKKLFLFVLVLFLAGNTFAQEKWSVDKSTPKPPYGKYDPLPLGNADWVNPNRQIVVYMTPAGTMAVSPNMRVLPNSNQQNEVILTRHPLNPMIMFGSANTTTTGGAYGQGCYVTTNGGVNWYGTDLLPNMPSSTSDPAVIIDKDGRFIFNTLNTVSTAILIGNYSTDNGVTWSTPVTIYGSSCDKNFCASDESPASPYYGRSYAVVTKWSTPYPIMFSYTTNQGVSWSTAQQINNSPSGLSQGCDIIVNHLGHVLVTWSAQSASVSDYVGFAKSTNGGINWTVTENAFDVNGMRSSSFNGWGVRVNDFPRIGVDRSGGERNGWIYIVDCEQNLAPAGSDADVILHRSTDNGVTWSGGIRVNQDALNNGKVQFFPAIRVDESGGINVVYYDNRNYPSVGDSCEVYVSRSIDGGNTWTDIKVSDHRWKPAPEFGTYMGDYIGITSGANKVWPFWTDNKTGSFQAWTCYIELGPSVSHTALGNTEQTTGTRVVSAVITPAGSGINPSTVKLYYSKDNPSITNNVSMTNSGGNNWTGNLPLSGAGLYRYYLTATDSLNRTATSPAGAPSVYHSFIAATDTVKPVITHTPLSNIPRLQWPASLSAVVTDNIGVDSVWVKWYKNGTSTGIKRFNLARSGDNWTGTFNSDTSQVAVNDSIFYRVFARDAGTLHNTDSTALYKFKIINQVTVTIGTGTTSSNFPFTTYWMDGRTQYLYLASELNMPSGYIAKIGFDVITAQTQVMNEFTISCQNTTASTLTGFVSTGWTTAHGPIGYSVPGTGWQMIDLAQPFYYTAGSNLLIDICYNNSSYTQFSTVNSTAAPNMFWGRYGDLSSASGCGYTAWTLTTAPPGRANTRFVMNPGTVGVENKLSNLPTSYSLSQNFPNPFNPVTKINFALPKQGFVTLKVFDILGREIKTLVNEMKNAGIYSVDFNASEYSSGVYFYRLETNGFSDIKRMMLIK